MTLDTGTAEGHSGGDAGVVVGRTGDGQMLGFWGTVAVVVALVVIVAWFADHRRRAGGSGLSDRERVSFDRRQNDPYGHGDNFGGGGGAGGGPG